MEVKSMEQQMLHAVSFVAAPHNQWTVSGDYLLSRVQS